MSFVWSAAVEKALPALGIKPELQAEISFHLGDIAEEVILLASLLGRIRDGGKLNAEESQRVLYWLGTHWHYHLGEVNRLIADDEDDER